MSCNNTRACLCDNCIAERARQTARQERGALCAALIECETTRDNALAEVERLHAEVDRLDAARRRDALRAADAERELARLKGEGWPQK